MSRQKKSLEHRFWKKVNIKGPDDCWDWLGGNNGDGYGLIKINEKSKLVHRISWSLAKGFLDEDNYVLHKCDNRKCCNPNHLFLGTQQQNVKDMYKKGRGPIRSIRLTEKEVLKIRADNRTQSEIAKDFSVSRQHISSIKNRRSWT